MTEPDSPTRRVDPTTGRPILLAPRRQQRPLLTHAKNKGATCPFCPGNEQATPPETFAVREHDNARDVPGWRVRVFDNLYPAARHHEVIAEGAEHVEQPADLPEELWREILFVWQHRVRAMEEHDQIACAFLFKNVGALAGASIAHSHSQLSGLADLPPRLLLEIEQAGGLDECPWCQTARTAADEGRVVHAAGHHVALVPDPPKLPFETWVLPRHCDDDFLTTDRESLAHVLYGVFQALRDNLGSPAWNLWLHRAPGRRFHWHFEIQPRTGHLAGLALGGDRYINAVPAKDAAARLRGRRISG